MYQVADYIEATLESALAQTFDSIEYLVVDDCSQDNSLAIVKQLCESHARGNSIRVLTNLEHKGVSYTRNRIIAEAQGRYLYFLDSDDMIEQDTIQLLYHEAKCHQAEIVYGSYEIIDRVRNSPTRVFQKLSLLLVGDGKLAEYAFENSHIFHVSVCNCLIDMVFLRNCRVRFIDAMFWEDMAFTYELVTKVNRAVLLPNITYHYVCRPGSLSNYQERSQLEKDEIMRNVAVLDYLKAKCIGLTGKAYLPFLCYNLEMSSFYIVCHIIKHSSQITPVITYNEMRQMLHSPLPLHVLIRYRQKLLANVLMLLLGHLPLPLFKPSIWLLGKMKKAI